MERKKIDEVKFRSRGGPRHRSELRQMVERLPEGEVLCTKLEDGKRNRSHVQSAVAHTKKLTGRKLSVRVLTDGTIGVVRWPESSESTDETPSEASAGGEARPNAKKRSTRK